MACSSDEETSLNDWLDSQGIAVSYDLDTATVKATVKSVKVYSDSSATESSIGALGNVNGVEHTLYFLMMRDSVKSVLNLSMDSSFYKVFYGDEFPLLGSAVSAKIYWLNEPDSSWLKLGKSWSDSADIEIVLDKSFYIDLPEKFLETNSKYMDSLLFGLRLVSNDVVLRILPPSYAVMAHRARILENCSTCLYAGIRDSLVVSFDFEREIFKGRTVVLAQLTLPKTADKAESEFDHPIPLYVYYDSAGVSRVESYVVDTAYVQSHDGHPNLLWDKNESLKLQVTKGLRNCNSDSFSVTLRFGNPMLIPKSLYFYNSAYLEEQVFATYPDYAKYDFAGIEGKDVDLKIWFADYGDKK